MAARNKAGSERAAAVRSDGRILLPGSQVMACRESCGDERRSTTQSSHIISMLDTVTVRVHDCCDLQFLCRCFRSGNLVNSVCVV